MHTCRTCCRVPAYLLRRQSFLKLLVLPACEQLGITALGCLHVLLMGPAGSSGARSLLEAHCLLRLCRRQLARKMEKEQQDKINEQRRNDKEAGRGGAKDLQVRCPSLQDWVQERPHVGKTLKHGTYILEQQ